MSVKVLVIALGITGGILYSVDAPKPDPATADPEIMAAAVVPHGVAARINYGLGALGSRLVAGTVLSNAAEVQTELGSLRKSLKAKKGRDGDHAREAAKVADQASHLAIQNIYAADPVDAVRNVMKAKNHIDVAKKNLATPSS